VLIVVMARVGPAVGQDGRATGVRASAVRAEAAPIIDGVLADVAWSEAPVISGFVQREPLEGTAASERTEVRILYDDQALYLAAWLFDADPSSIVFGETRRDADLTDTDALLILLDTYLDRQNGFVFGTTPAGIEYDGQVTREGEGGFGGQVRQQTGSGGGFNKNWDGSWDVAATRDGAGWYAEFRIPFSTLRYGSGGPQTWGLNIARRIRRRNEEVFWSPIPRQFDLYRVSQAGTLVDFEAPARRLFTVTPYVLASGSHDYLVEDGGDITGDIGGDAKLGLTPGLTLDLTVNTDFAQVEVDDEQVNLTRFELFFPEKRPFFLENAGTFAVGTPQDVDLFFSRRIGIEDSIAVPILGGGRVTGKVGGVTVGLLNIQAESVDGAPGETPLAPANNFGVVRLLQELPNRSRIGGIFVSRVNTGDGDDHNLTFGVDGRVGIGNALTFDGYAARTETPDLTGAQHAFSLSGSLSARDWSMGAAFREVAEAFNPEVGFLPRRDYRFRSARILRNVRIPSIPWFRELRPHISYNEFLDLDGFSESRLIHIDSHFEFSNGAFFQLPALNFTREGLKEPFEIADDIIVPPGTYDNFEWGFEFNSDLSAPLSVDTRIEIGGFYTGHRKGTTTTLNARVNAAFVASLRVSYFDVDLAEGSFETSVVGLRAAYSFSPRMYVQALVQYNEQSDNVSSNVRFGWLNTAGTGLFVVYNDIEHTGSLSRTGLDAGPTSRALVVKFTQQFNVMQ
jgi:hypothetical protein